MGADFVHFNLYVYYSMQGMVLDVVIWCLAPMIDDKREYGLLRMFLAGAMLGVCRTWMGIRGN